MMNFKINSCFLLGTLTLTSYLASPVHAFTTPPASPTIFSTTNNGLFMTPDEPGEWFQSESPQPNTAPPPRDYLPMGRSYYPPTPDYYGPPQRTGTIPGPAYFDRAPSPLRAPSYHARVDPMGYNNGRRRVPGPGYLDSVGYPQPPQPLQPQPQPLETRRSTQELRQDYHNGRRRSERPVPNSQFTPGLWAAENIRVRGRPNDDRNTEKRWNSVRSDNFYLDRHNLGPLEDYSFADFIVSPPRKEPNNNANANNHNSVAMMMTQEQKRILIEELGFRRSDVKRLKFDKVQEIIQNRIRCPPDGPIASWLE